MAILVTGGAGYIGSHTVAEFIERGEDVIILDNLQKGHAEAVLAPNFYQGDLRDSNLLDRIFAEHDIEAVIHFAADSLVGESVSDPLKYYQNNIASTLNLVTKMKEHGVNKIVFSSTAATYGEPRNNPIQESDPTLPTNPYGETKLAIEKMLHWCDQAYGIHFVALRYFNAAGADPNGRIGEDHHPETHLIPLILQVALGQRESITIFGQDYPTPDGTCVRDYVHVLDLAQAHYLALNQLRKTQKSGIYNLGNGQGFSVSEVIEAARRVTGHLIPARLGERRAGDPAVLIASSQLAQEELGWVPQWNRLEQILQTAWNWHKNHPQGFNK
ncbi:UDP-glucose 4-epimerase GalE [Desulfitobacterium sp. Sab5]|uniref:UDP-glucose 4-epimerase GalE n=1 Tax=Desulfitobacterium nosdiversum TaxID=3375356 RepID=UPI003CF65B31